VTQKRKIVCPYNSSWYILLDKSEIFPDDPGNGTPALVVYGPTGQSATYNCAVNEGEVDCGARQIPSKIFEWVENQEDVVNEFLWPEEA
jgi:hypothetical protein